MTDFKGQLADRRYHIVTDLRQVSGICYRIVIFGYRVDLSRRYWTSGKLTGHGAMDNARTGCVWLEGMAAGQVDGWTMVGAVG